MFIIGTEGACREDRWPMMTILPIPSTASAKSSEWTKQASVCTNTTSNVQRWTEMIFDKLRQRDWRSEGQKDRRTERNKDRKRERQRERKTQRNTDRKQERRKFYGFLYYNWVLNKLCKKYVHQLHELTFKKWKKWYDLSVNMHLNR